MANSEEQFDEIISQYIHELVTTTKFYPAIAFYTSTLAPSRQVAEYGEFLLRIEDGEDRRDAMVAADKAGLDTDEIIAFVVRNTQQRSLNLNPEQEVQDAVKVNSLSWFEYLERHKSLEFKEANRLIREFLLMEKLDLADRILSREVLFQRAVDEKARLGRREGEGEEEEEGEGEDAEEKRGEQESELDEFMFFTFLLRGFKSYYDWEDLCQSPPPIPSSSSFSSSSFHNPRFTEATLSSREIQANYEKQKQSWEERKNSFHESAVDGLQSSARGIKYIIDGIIQQDEQHQIHHEKQKRIEELEELQQIYVPKLIFHLFNLFMGREMWQKGLQLINFVTENDLLQYFSRDDAKSLMERMQVSSMKLLEAGVDPSQIP